MSDQDKDIVEVGQELQDRDVDSCEDTGESNAITPGTPRRMLQDLAKKEQEVRDQISFLTTLKQLHGMYSSPSWSIPELIFGIKWLHKTKKKREFTEFETPIEIDECVYNEMKEVLRHINICSFIDKKPRAEFLTSSQLRDEDLYEYYIHSTAERNGYLILINHEFKEVVLYINGTQSLNDMMIDLHSRAIPFKNGYAHHGMSIWADWFLCRKAGTLKMLLEKHEGYSLVLCGHSLGGATAVLVGFLLRDMFPDLKVFAFAVPKCISKELVEESETFVKTIIFMDDFIPLMGEHTWNDLRRRVRECEWKSQFINDISSTKPVKLILKWTPSSLRHYFSKTLVKVSTPTEDDHETHSSQTSQVTIHFSESDGNTEVSETLNITETDNGAFVGRKKRIRRLSEKEKESENDEIELIEYTPPSTNEPFKSEGSNSTEIEKFPIDKDSTMQSTQSKEKSSEELPLSDDKTESETKSSKDEVSKKEIACIPLYNPGKIYYIREFDGEFKMIREKWDSERLNTLEFNRSFLKDHLSASYLKGISGIVKSYEDKLQMESKKEALRKLISFDENLL